MISMHGVPSSLILRNESWVRKQASSLARRLPSNVERADLIQAGLIAVAQAATGFVWEGDRDTEEAKEAFVRYAQRRVYGAMIDELRQMDHMSRPRRRQVKLLEVARERWRSAHGSEASAETLSQLCDLSVDEIFELQHEAAAGQVLSATEDAEHEAPRHEPATAADEVEARVDTGMLMRRLESFFAKLPERERQVIDAYLGVGLSPVQLAQQLKMSTSRLSQMFKSLCDRIGLHLDDSRHRAIDRLPASDPASAFDERVAHRDDELEHLRPGGAWGQRLEKVLVTSSEDYPEGQPIDIKPGTRWG